jgi:serine/threonine-protein kinase
MARVRLDPQGRLLRFDAVPPPPKTGENTGAEPDWTALFERAGIELSAFTPTQPTRVASTRYDVRQAWEGVFPGQPEVTIRIEAGAFQGRPVFFQVVTPWTPSPQGDLDSQSAGKQAANIVSLVIAFGVLVCALPLARRNMTTGRGDRRSAFRTATCVLVLGMAYWVLQADHEFTFSGLSLFLHHLAWNLLGAGCVWVIYIALEPFVRRFWPRAIVSWNRLLQGRFRDPMVGRDILMGATIGLLFNAPFAIWGILFPSEQLDPTTGLVALDGLVGVRQSVAAYFAGARGGLAVTVWIVLLLVLLRVVVRRPWAAVTVLFLLLVAPNTLWFGLPDVWPFWLHTALIVLALVRFGVLGCAAALFFAFPSSFVLTLDPTAWYVGRSILTLLVLAAIAGYGFYISLGGQPLFRDRVLDG